MLAPAIRGLKSSTPKHASSVIRANKQQHFEDENCDKTAQVICFSPYKGLQLDGICQNIAALLCVSPC